jgi:prolyl-tRNA editing enzyme YbaK/EbsC (Cys-tRNA(Pro) deacylase)
MTPEVSMAQQAHEDVVAFISAGIPTAKLYEHPECRTSAESIEARYAASGLRVPGAKSLLMKLDVKDRDDVFAAIILPGFNKLDSKALKSELKTRVPGMQRMRFATPEEMFDIARGMQPGKMPPIGRPIFPKITYTFFDSALLDHELVGFNAAYFEKSFIVPTKELIALVPHDGVFTCSLGSFV